MKKKILAAALAMTMMLGSSVGALASADPVQTPDANGVYGAAIEATGDIETPTINVEVPTALTFTLNPYQMEVEGTGGDKFTDQVVAADSEIINNSNVGISINVADLGTEKVDGSELTLLAAPPTAAVTTKSAFLYVELKDDAKSYIPYKPTNPTQLAVPTTKTASKTDMLVLGAKAADAAEGTKAQFKVAGNVVANPAKAWAEADTIKVKFKLTFTPQVNKTK